MQTVENFFLASKDIKQKREDFVTRRYLNYRKEKGYNGADLGQRAALSSDQPAPYEDFAAVNMKQMTKQKFYIYCQQNDPVLSQHRFSVVLTESGWQIDDSQKLSEGKWQFCSLR